MGDSVASRIFSSTMRGFCIGLICTTVGLPIYSTWISPLRMIGTIIVAAYIFDGVTAVSPRISALVERAARITPIPWQLSIGLIVFGSYMSIAASLYWLLGISITQDTTIARLIGYPILFAVFGFFMEGTRLKTLEQKIGCGAHVAVLIGVILPYYLITGVLNRMVM